MPLENPGIASKIILKGVTKAGSFLLPANCMLREIIVNNQTSFGILGGMKFGSVPGGADVVATLQVAAMNMQSVTDAALLFRYFSALLDKAIYYDAITSWSGASVDITIVYWRL